MRDIRSFIESFIAAGKPGALLALSAFLVGCGGGSYSTDSLSAPEPTSAAISGPIVRDTPAAPTTPVVTPTPTPVTPEPTPVELTRETADVEINWTAPATREDGSSLPIAEIAGYEIVTVNLDSGATRSYQVDEGVSSSFLLSQLQPANYRLYLFVYDSNNLISDPTVLPDLTVDQFPTS